jgi:hypothetical protein
LGQARKNPVLALLDLLLWECAARSLASWGIDQHEQSLIHPVVGHLASPTGQAILGADIDRRSLWHAVMTKDGGEFIPVGILEKNVVVLQAKSLRL